MQEEKQKNTAGGESRFCYYENLFQLTTGKTLSLSEVYELVKGPALRHITGEIRRAIAEGNPAKAKALKMQLPAIAVSCLFPGERRTEEAGDNLSSLLVHFDHLTCPPAELLERCRAYPFVAFAHVSASGDGLHLMVRVDTGRESHAVACDVVHQFFETEFGHPVDHTCTDFTRTALLCHDPEAYVNTQATAYAVESGKVKGESGKSGKKLSTFNSQLSTDSGECLRRYLDVADLSLAWVKGQRHANLVSLAFTLNRAGFDEQAVVRECIARYVQPDFGDKEVSKVIASAYAKGRAEHGCNRKEFTFGASVRSPEKEASSAHSACSALYTPPLEENTDIGLEYKRLEKAKEMAQCFPDAVYEHLPPFFKEMFTEGLTEVERSVALVGSLGIFSAAMPNVSGSYQNALCEPPLYCCVAGAASSGKGMINKIHKVFHVYAEGIRRESAKEVKVYNNKMKQYNFDMLKVLKSKGELSDEPECVRQKGIELAGNISRPRMIEQLADNGHYASLMCETEIDVLNNSMEQDHGQYHDLLNQIFQHEQVSKDTKQDKYYSSTFPRMALVFSGTEGQVTRLIHSTEDGLFSRLLCFYISGQSQWKPLTDADDTPRRGNYYYDLGHSLQEIALFLDQHPTWVSYTESQRAYMNEVFPLELERLRAFGEGDKTAILFRLGMIHFRICMIFTGLRKGERRLNEKNIKISDEDFYTAIQIIFHCLNHSLVLSTLLKKDEVLKPISNPIISEQLFSELGENFNTCEAIEKGHLLGMEKRTVESALTRWCKKGLIVRITKGKYMRNKLKNR